MARRRGKRSHTAQGTKQGRALGCCTGRIGGGATRECACTSTANTNSPGEHELARTPGCCDRPRQHDTGQDSTTQATIARHRRDGMTTHNGAAAAVPGDSEWPCINQVPGACPPRHHPLDVSAARPDMRLWASHVHTTHNTVVWHTAHTQLPTHLCGAPGAKYCSHHPVRSWRGRRGVLRFRFFRFFRVCVLVCGHVQLSPGPSTACAESLVRPST